MLRVNRLPVIRIRIAAGVFVALGCLITPALAAPASAAPAGPAACTSSRGLVSSDRYEADQVFPVSSAGNPRCTLRRGDNGPGVRALQRSLKVCYRAPIAVDGAFGPRTEAALADVQRRLGLAGSGVYGSGTRVAMYRNGGIAWRTWQGSRTLCTRLGAGAASGTSRTAGDEQSPAAERRSVRRAGERRPSGSISERSGSPFRSRVR